MSIMLHHEWLGSTIDTTILTGGLAQQRGHYALMPHDKLNPLGLLALSTIHSWFAFLTLFDRGEIVLK